MIDKKFIDWFYVEIYAEPNHNRNGWMRDHADLQKHECRDWWMRQAFKAGYNQRKQDEIAEELDCWMDELNKDFKNE
jgi:hypothetical protein